jgi:hypothetical protein
LNAPEQGQKIIDAILKLIDIKTVEELQARVEALEARGL